MILALNKGNQIKLRNALRRTDSSRAFRLPALVLTPTQHDSFAGSVITFHTL